MKILGPNSTLTEWETMGLGPAFKPIKNCSQRKWNISAKKKGLGGKKKKKKNLSHRMQFTHSMQEIQGNYKNQ